MPPPDGGRYQLLILMLNEGETMIICIDKDNLLLVFESCDQTVNKMVSDKGWDMDEVDFYTDQGQRLRLKGDSFGGYRLVPYGRPCKENLQALFARSDDIVYSTVSTIKNISDLKKALSWEDTI